MSLQYVQQRTNYLRTVNKKNGIIERLNINSIRNCIRRGRLTWFGDVKRCSNDSQVKKCRGLVAEGQQRKGKNRKTWYQVMDSDLRSLKINRDLAQNRTEWKTVIKKTV